MAEVVDREGADVVIYDQEFTGSVDQALADRPDAVRILGWTDSAATDERTVDDVDRRARRSAAAPAAIARATSFC